MDSSDAITGPKSPDSVLDPEDRHSDASLSVPPDSEQSAIGDEEPVIEKETLKKKLENIPEETLRKILSEQVDLEVRLKHKELALTEEELGKCEAQMLAIRQFFEVPAEISFEKEPNQFTLKYYDLLNRSLSVNYTKLQQQQYQHEQPKFNEDVFVEQEPAHSYRTRSTTSSLRPSLGGPAVRVSGCLYRRTDGVIVKLTCPDCQRSNFSSAQGFLNHSRIAHTKEYTSQDAAALRCGEILPEQFQDEEGLASLKCLATKGLDPCKNLNVNEIYFNGLSNTLNTVHRASQTAEDDAPKSTPKATAESVAAYTGSDELMKKVIKSGITHDEREYAELVQGVREPVANSHLFNDEEEVESLNDVTETTTSAPATIATSRTTTSATTITSTGSGATTGASTGTDGDGVIAAVGATGTGGDGGGSVRAPGHGRVVGAAGVGDRAEIGGKYENRLRRRKSRESFAASRDVMRDAIGSTRGAMTGDTENAVEEDRRHKRRKSHRGA